MSKVTAYYHIVFCTKRREKTIAPEHKEDLYRYIWKIISDANCDLIRIGGISDHIHILLDLHPSKSLSDLVKNIKSMSSGWMKSCGMFPRFDGWASEYFACTASPEFKSAIVEYIKGQETHHNATKFDDELAGLYRYSGKEYIKGDMT